MSDKETSKLDEMIKAALTGQDRQIFEETKELDYFALGLKQFGGKLGWVTWVLMIVQGIMSLIAIWCGIQFYQATEVLPAIKWGISCAVLALMATQIKLSLAPQMQADRVIREVKRVELLLVSKLK